MTDNTPKLSLVRKLSEVMALVEYVPKNGTNPHFGYKYAMESDITDAVRSELAKRQVVLIPSVEKVEVIEGKNAKGNVERIYTITAKFMFYDGESGETLPFVMVGQGSDPSDKGTSKALTSLVKYALLKSLLIPTGDDPEKEEAAPLAKPAAPKPPAKPVQPAPKTSEREAAQTTGVATKNWSELGEPLTEVAKLEVKMTEAQTAEDLTVIASGIADAAKAGGWPDADVKALRSHYTKRMNALLIKSQK